MKVLACLPTYGAGTPNVESFTSILRRTSKAYEVGLLRVVSLLGRVDDRKSRSLYKGHIHGSGLHGWLPTARLLTRSMERLTGCAGYERHTLLKLSGVFAANSRLFFNTDCRWCPICLDPDVGVDYELLAHSLADVIRCPLHGAALIKACLACGAKRPFRTEGPLQRSCSKCGDPLFKQRTVNVDANPTNDWKEKQVLKLIAYCSDNSPPPGEDWMARLRDGHAQLGRTHQKLYSRSERAVFYNIVAGSGRVHARSLFQFAAIQSVDVVDVLLQPEACCSPRLPEIASVRTPASRRISSKEKVQAASNAVEALLATDEAHKLPGLGPVCRGSGACSKALYDDFPELYRRYGIERRRRQLLHLSHMLERTTVAAREALEHVDSHGLTVRQLGKQISNRVGAAKHIAEEGVRRALRESHRSWP